MGITYKSNFEGDVRRFSSDYSLTYTRLKDKLINLYNLYDIPFNLTYLDDGDNITIADEKDLEEAHLLLGNEILRLTLTRKSDENKNNNSSNIGNIDSLFVQLLSNQFVQQMIPQVMNSLATNPALMTSIIQTAGTALRNNSNNNNNNNNSNINNVNSENINNSCNIKRHSPHLLNASLGNNFHTRSTDSIVAIIDQENNNSNNNNNGTTRIALTSSNGNESCNGSFSSSISFEMVNKESDSDNQYSTPSSTTSSTTSSNNNNNGNSGANNNGSLNNRPPSPMENNKPNSTSTSPNTASPVTTTTTSTNNNRLSGLPKSIFNILPFTTNSNNNNNKSKPVEEPHTTAAIATTVTATTTTAISISTPPTTINSSPKQEHHSGSPTIQNSPNHLFTHNFNNPYIYQNNPGMTPIVPPPIPQPHIQPTPISPQPPTAPPQQQQPTQIEQPQQPQINSENIKFIKDALQISETQAIKLFEECNGDLDKIFEKYN